MSQVKEPGPATGRFGFLTIVGIITVIIIAVIGTAIVWRLVHSNAKADRKQDAFNAFYTPPSPIPAKLGSIIRVEPLGVSVPNGAGYRVLYTSKGPKGNPVAVSGMIFVPNGTAPKGGRPVVAWAHGTVGLAAKCAPSRSDNVLGDTDPWLGLAMQRGWVVAATDYLGLGTPGPKTYLIGQQEAADVVNSVRAAQQLPQASASNRWIVWGHSQGGQSALWTGSLAGKLAPELKLLGVGAAAPADELTTIVAKQWPTTIGWVIGPEAAISFMDNYPGYDFMSPISDTGKTQMNALQNACIKGGGLRGLANESLGGQFFKSNPLDTPAWAQVALAQTPKALPASMPLFLTEVTNDTVVLSGSNALMQNEWCKAGSTLYSDWIGGLNHMEAATSAGPGFIEWATGRFGGKSAPTNCGYPPASPPLAKVVIPPQVLAADPTQASVPSSTPAPSASTTP